MRLAYPLVEITLITGNRVAGLQRQYSRCGHSGTLIPGRHLPPSWDRARV